MSLEAQIDNEAYIIEPGEERGMRVTYDSPVYITRSFTRAMTHAAISKILFVQNRLKRDDAGYLYMDSGNRPQKEASANQLDPNAKSIHKQVSESGVIVIPGRIRQADADIVIKNTTRHSVVAAEGVIAREGDFAVGTDDSGRRRLVRAELSRRGPIANRGSVRVILPDNSDAEVNFGPDYVDEDGVVMEEDTKVFAASHRDPLGRFINLNGEIYFLPRVLGEHLHRVPYDDPGTDEKEHLVIGAYEKTGENPMFSPYVTKGVSRRHVLARHFRKDSTTAHLEITDLGSSLGTVVSVAQNGNPR